MIGACRNLNIWDVFWTNQIQMRQCRRKVVRGGRVAGAIRSLVNARGLQLKCVMSYMNHCLCLFLVR